MSDQPEEWMEWVWPGYHWYQAISPAYAYLEDMPKLGYQFSKMAFAYSKGTTSFYFIRSEYEKNGKSLFDNVLKGSDQITEVLNKISDTADLVFKLVEEFSKVDFSVFSNEELIDHHKKLFALDDVLWRSGQIINLVELHNSYLSDHVKNILKEKFADITVSSYESVFEKQNRDFLILLKEQADELKPDLIRQHSEKYVWMSYGWEGPALSYEYFLDSFKEALKDGEIIKILKQSILEKETALKIQKDFLSKLDPKDRELATLLRRILEQKSKRVDAHSATYFIAEKMMKEIGRRVGLSLSQMRVVPPKDVPGLFQKVDLAKINEDCRYVMLWHEQSKTFKLSGKQAEEKAGYIADQLPKIEMLKEFRGDIAYTGRVIAVAKIVLSMKESGGFKEGEVLVTRMTGPDFLPLMKIAGAIITDIGGITCHASIVARELKKPCIIGTKIATKVLKDGDMVEVDAEKGIVRIIK